MDYSFAEIEKKWQRVWADSKVYKTQIDLSKPKYYVLDMFPYPSGAGLHVGHPLGYIASDIYSRYKRLKGFNVLHPMGYDAFGLPTEQYAIQTGQHPKVTTEKNTARYREQLDKIGFCYDWDREFRTSDPNYYKWTQWTFIRLFNSYYCNQTKQARHIQELIELFSKHGVGELDLACSKPLSFKADEWNLMNEKEQSNVLMNYRLAYLADTAVNWCPALGCVLANDEVSEGFSVRGGYPVERKIMNQWSLRITAYAERLLMNLETIDWSESIKEIQRNWIGKSIGCAAHFKIKNYSDISLEVFTTRADTMFGVTFMVIAPEHPFVERFTTADRKEAVDSYTLWAKNRSERERLTEVKKVSGEFTGSYAINPLNGTEIPIYIADYVLMGYGTGAIMAVPGHDSRDFAFARHFKLPIIQVVCKKDEQPSNSDTWDESYDSKDGVMINSGFITGMDVQQAIAATIKHIEENDIGKGTINYRLRDAIFSRQRYWGEPFPIYYKNGIPHALDEKDLPLQLPDIDKYLPTETGEPPLARAKNWTTKDGYPLETATMPGFAGSCAYYLRYMDPKNDNAIFSKDAINYWQNVDLYMGGAEHATGHLIYARFWNKFLFDLGCSKTEEPFKKLINQGMIQGRSSFVYRIVGTNQFVSHNLRNQYENTQAIHVDVNIVDTDVLDTEKFKQWLPDFANAEFILENGKYICGWEIEKMSKSMHNVVNPDLLIEKYGADTLRLYEMFLGPIEQSKPWDTNGVEGVFRFLRKLWRLFHNADMDFVISDETPLPKELKVLHRTIKKTQDDIDRFSFNTVVSSFMICVNELSDLKCNKRAILHDLVILISPYAPHIAEELWHLLGNKESINLATFPMLNLDYLVENSFVYPVSFNGKTRFTMEFPLDQDPKEMEQAVATAAESEKYLEGKQPKKIIIVKGRIINVVI